MLGATLSANMSTLASKMETAYNTQDAQHVWGEKEKGEDVGAGASVDLRQHTSGGNNTPFASRNYMLRSTSAAWKHVLGETSREAEL